MPHAKYKIEDAHAQFSELLDRARAGEEILITKNREPHARILPPTRGVERIRDDDETSATKGKPGMGLLPPKRHMKRKKAPLKHLNLPSNLFDDEYPEQTASERLS